MAQAIQQESSDPVTWDLVALLRQHWGEDDASALRMGTVARGAPLDVATPSIPAITRDVAALRSYPADTLVSGALRLLTRQAWPWVLEPLLAP